MLSGHTSMVPLIIARVSVFPQLDGRHGNMRDSGDGCGVDR